MSRIIDPRELAEVALEHRNLYRREYLVQTSRLRPGMGPIRLKAWTEVDDEVIGFPQDEIVVSFSDQPHPTVWSSNVIQNKPDGSRIGYIQILKDLDASTDEFRKFLFAKEWLEIIGDFARPGSRAAERKVAGRKRLIELYCALRRSNLWQNDSDEVQCLQIALQNLLVSTESIETFLSRIYGKSLSQLKALCNSENYEEFNEGRSLLEELENSFSIAKSVDRSVVRLRISQILFN